MNKRLVVFICLSLLLQACHETFLCRGLESDSEAIACLSKLPQRDVLEDKEFANYLKHHGIYLSVTTTPKRVPLLPLMFETLNLSLVKKVFLVLPKEFKNKKGAIYPAVPEKLLKLSKLEVLTPNEDYGPITKLIPVLERLKAEDPDGILITIDDDVGYAPGMPAELALASFKSHAAAAGGGQSAEFFGLDRGTHWIFPKRDSMDILEGVAAVAYKPSFFSHKDIEQMKTLVRNDDNCKFSDDFIVSHILEKNNIKKIVVKNKYIPEYVPFTYGFLEGALHLGANGEYLNPVKYQACGLRIKHEKMF